MALQVASQRPDDIGGLGFVCAVGLTKHRGLGSLELTRRILDLASASVVGRHVPGFIRWFSVTALGFPRRTRTDECMLMARRALLLDFDRQRTAVRAVAERGLPCFVAYATDDPLIESDISAAFSLALPPGPRLVFNDGGHNIQKVHANEVGAALLAWAGQVRDAGEEGAD